MAVYDGSNMQRPVRESDDVVTHMLTEAEVTGSAHSIRIPLGHSRIPMASGR